MRGRQRAASMLAGFAIAAVVHATMQAQQHERAAAITAATPRPYPTCINRFWLDEPVHPCQMSRGTPNPLRAATATAWEAYWPTSVATHAAEYTAQAIWEAEWEASWAIGTPTPCAVPPTPPVPWMASEPPCFGVFASATTQARIASGELYIIHSEQGPDGTHTTWIEGTVPPYAATAYAVYPATKAAVVATARALATAGLPDRAERNARRQDRHETRRWWKAATATAAAQTEAQP
jgi:hypothetical protein